MRGRGIDVNQRPSYREELGNKGGGDSLCETASFAVANSYRIFASWGCRRAAGVEWMECELDS